MKKSISLKLLCSFTAFGLFSSAHADDAEDIKILKTQVKELRTGVQNLSSFMIRNADHTTAINEIKEKLNLIIADQAVNAKRIENLEKKASQVEKEKPVSNEVFYDNDCADFRLHPNVVKINIPAESGNFTDQLAYYIITEDFSDYDKRWYSRTREKKVKQYVSKVNLEINKDRKYQFCISNKANSFRLADAKVHSPSFVLFKNLIYKFGSDEFKNASIAKLYKSSSEFSIEHAFSVYVYGYLKDKGAELINNQNFTYELRYQAEYNEYMFQSYGGTLYMLEIK